MSPEASDSPDRDRGTARADVWHELHPGRPPEKPAAGTASGSNLMSQEAASKCCT